jgi:hypothetical protein
MMQRRISNVSGANRKPRTPVNKLKLEVVI